METPHIKSTLNAITFAPSCVDMGWNWDLEEVFSESGTPMGWNLRTTFRRPDTDSGELGTGFGRWWFLAKDISPDGLVKTAWLAVNQIVVHELMEAFMFDGVRVFDPHAPIKDLVAMNRGIR